MIDRDRDFNRTEPLRPTGNETGTLGHGSDVSQMNKGTSDNLVDLAQQRGSQIADQAKQTTNDMMEQARNQLNTRVSEQKSVAAEGLSSVAQAVRQTGAHLRTQDQPMIAGYADKAAEQIDRFSGYLGESNLEDMVGEVERFARRQPLMFLGGALVAGFLGARFLKSSAPSTGTGIQGSGPIPGYRALARPDYPYRTGSGFGSGIERTIPGYPARDVSPAPGLSTGTGSLPGTTTGDSSDLTPAPGTLEDKDAAA